MVRDLIDVVEFLAGGLEDDLQSFDFAEPSLTGAKEFAAIRSYVATAAKHGITMFDALNRLTNQHPWHPATT